MMNARNLGVPIDAAALEAAIKESVQAAVDSQLEAGLTVINDGENSKDSWWRYITERLTGFGFVKGAPLPRTFGHGAQREVDDFPDFFEEHWEPDAFARKRGRPSERLCCTGPIEWRDFSQVERDIRSLKDVTRGRELADVFVTSPSPGSVLQAIPNRHFANDDEYLEAVGEALRREYQAIVDAGFVLQLDCPDLATRAGPTDENGVPLPYPLADFRRDIARNIEALNHATRTIDPDQMRIHVCWGSVERPHHTDVELASIVDILLTARPAGMTIVAANGRHEHEWQVWKDVKLPDGKVLIPGVIDSTTNIIEHPETVAERIERFASVLGRENIIAGVDCGFQTSVGRDQVDPKIAWAKLRSLAEGAELASRRLY